MVMDEIGIRSSKIEIIVKKTIALLILYSTIRLIFIILNIEVYKLYLSIYKYDNIVNLYIIGVWHDLQTIILTNSFIFISYICFVDNIYVNTLQRVLFIIINSLSVFISIADIFYFQHSLKRTSGAILGMIDGFCLMIFDYLREYWMGLVIFIAFFIVIIFISKFKKNTYGLLSIKDVFFDILFVIFICIISFESTNEEKGGRYELVTNTPLSIINYIFKEPNFLNKKALINFTIFTNDEAKRNIDFNKNYYIDSLKTKKMNVVIIVMESFSKKYIGFLNDGVGYTPFLDSLCYKSLVFKNSFANGRHSNEGIPAIFSSLPAFSREPFLISKYKSNIINGLPKILQKNGYSSAFFHGGVNGVYGFDYFSKKCGFDEYYGKNEYNNEKHFDGSWGIWDDKFFQFTSEKISNINQPFVVGLFSLSSHHPYRLPTYYKSEVDHNVNFLNSIRYADYSLRNFFYISSKQTWFNNTIFVITADHTALVGESESPEDLVLNKYSIPIIFYTPNKDIASGISESMAQQIDILPSIIDYLNINTSFSCIGNSLFSKKKNRLIVNFSDGEYWAADSLSIISILEDQIPVYNFEQKAEYWEHSSGKYVKKNGSSKSLKTDIMSTYLRSLIQYYNYSMNNNLLTQ